MDVTRDLFPAVVDADGRRFHPARLVVVGARALLFDVQARQAHLAGTMDVASVDWAGGPTTRITSPSGQQWTATVGGGCGCSSPLKRLRAEQLVALADGGR